MLCGCCQRIWLAFHSGRPCDPQTAGPSLFEYARQENTWPGAHHISDGSFVAAVQDGCYVCTIIERDCSSELRKQAEWFHTFYELHLSDDSDRHEHRYDLEFTVEILRGQWPIPQKHVFECRGKFKILPWQGLSQIPSIWRWTIIERVAISTYMNPDPRTENTFSTTYEKLVSSWLEICNNVHKHCAPRPDRTKSSKKQLLDIYPTRILNISATQGERFRLELSENMSTLPKYVTLSHCWGKIVPLMLETGNLHEFTAGIRLSKLSSRFQDAVKIARWMGIEYIWIDALCIIQNSKADWRSESIKMGEIYSNSYCNIAATSSDDHKGCFTDKPTEPVVPCAVSDPLSDDLEKTHILEYDNFWCNSLLNTALHNRGWVIQERVLSPRIIHFGQEQLFWECRVFKACEAYPGGIPEAFCSSETRAWQSLSGALGETGHQRRSHATTMLSVLQSFGAFLAARVPLYAGQMFSDWIGPATPRITATKMENTGSKDPDLPDMNL